MSWSTSRLRMKPPCAVKPLHLCSPKAPRSRKRRRDSCFHNLNGYTLYYHTAITPVIVCPGHAQVIALAPEYIMPQDGHDKQDCEQAAGTRWITQHASTLVPHQVTLLGDDLYSKAPFCALALHQGFNFILVCKPDSHPKLYERLAFWQTQGTITQCEQRRRQGRLT